MACAGPPSLGERSGRLNICLVSREYPPDSLVGGIGTYTHHIARALANRGHETHVVAETDKEPSVRLENGVIVHRLARPKGALKEIRLLRRARAVEAEVRSIGRLDVVQACEYCAEGYYLARGRIAPLVTRLATPLFLVNEIEGRHSLRGMLLAYRLERLQTVRSDLVIASTRALAERVCRAWRLPPSHVSIVPNGLDLAHVRTVADGRRETPPPPGSRYLIYFGRLEERKGVHLLANALSWVMRDHPDLWAVFAGANRPFRGGSMRDFIETQLKDVRDRVVIRDLLPPARLLPLLAGASVAVLPSLWEAFGFVCLEAMALGVPVVATAGSGFAEIIEDGISGILVSPGDATLLGGRLDSLLHSPEELRGLGERGRQRAEHFDVSRICERLERLYASLRDSTAAGRLSRASAPEGTLGQ